MIHFAVLKLTQHCKSTILQKIFLKKELTPPPPPAKSNMLPSDMETFEWIELNQLSLAL